MLRTLQTFLTRLSSPETLSADQAEHQLKIAATALMVEVMRVDDQKTESEVESVLLSIMQHFDMDRDEADQILQLASQALHDSTDYHQFTSLIKQHYGQSERQQMVLFLWQVAYADGSLDSYEEHVIRKVSDLLYVSHRDFIRLKEKVRATISP